jgi:hypothetical protein
MWAGPVGLGSGRPLAIDDRGSGPDVKGAPASRRLRRFRCAPPLTPDPAPLVRPLGGGPGVRVGGGALSAAGASAACGPVGWRRGSGVGWWRGLAQRPPGGGVLGFSPSLRFGVVYRESHPVGLRVLAGASAKSCTGIPTWLDFLYRIGPEAASSGPRAPHVTPAPPPRPTQRSEVLNRSRTTDDSRLAQPGRPTPLPLAPTTGPQTPTAKRPPGRSAPTFPRAALPIAFQRWRGGGQGWAQPIAQRRDAGAPLTPGPEPRPSNARGRPCQKRSEPGRGGGRRLPGHLEPHLG